MLIYPYLSKSKHKTLLSHSIKDSNTKRRLMSLIKVHSSFIVRNSKGTHIIVPFKNKLISRSMSKWNGIKEIAKKLFGVPEALQKDLLITQRVHMAQNNALILRKDTLPAPLMYTPKHFRFWIPEDINRYRISGIASLTVKERTILQYRHCASTNIQVENHAYYIAYAKLICLIKTQIFFYCFEHKHSFDIEDMLPIFQKIYAVPVAVYPWLKNKAFKDLYEAKAAAMIQHFLAMTYGNTEFILNLNHPYIVSDTKKGTISTVGELFVLDISGIPSHLKDLNINIRLITPGVDFLTSGDIFRNSESLQQINQQNSDYIGYSLQIEQGGVKVIKYYRDVKMDYTGPLKGHFSFKALASIDVKTVRTLANDVITSLVRLQKGPYSTESKKLCRNSEASFYKIRTNVNEDNVYATYQNICQSLIKLTFSPTLIKDNIHFSVIIAFEKNSDTIMDEMITRIEQDPNLLEYLAPEIHYPQSARISRISWEQYHKLSLKGIKAHLPLAQQESVIENYMSIYLDLLEKHAILLT